jgi:hypothetical protein
MVCNHFKVQRVTAARLCRVNESLEDPVLLLLLLLLLASSLQALSTLPAPTARPPTASMLPASFAATE